MRTSKEKYIKPHKSVYFILLIILILGICAGACLLVFFDIDSPAQLDILHHNFIFTGSVNVSNLFVKNIKYPLILFCVLFICGFSAVLQPLELGTIFLHGVSCGLSASYYYSYFGLRGVFIALLLILPFFVAKSILLIAAARYSLRLSQFINRILLSGVVDDANDEVIIKEYSIGYFILMLIMALVCLLQSFAVSALRGIL